MKPKEIVMVFLIGLQIIVALAICTAAYFLSIAKHVFKRPPIE